MGEPRREPDLPRDPQGRDEFTERRPAPRGEPPRPDFSRSDILRADVAAVRKELLGDIKANDEASRERDKELHAKIEEWYDDVDEKVDAQARELVELRTKCASLKETVDKASRDEFSDVPWYARPRYVKAMGLAFAAVIAAVLTSLGLIFGWGHATEPATHPAPEAGASAPADPGMPEEGAPDGG